MLKIYYSRSTLTICPHDQHSQSRLRLSSHDLCSRFTHDLRSRSALTICNSRSALAIYAHGLRSRSGAHDLTLTIYTDGLRSRSTHTTIYLRSRSTLAVCAHDLALTICAHDHELHRDNLYQLTCVRSTR